METAHILLAGVPYSPNVGDGVIADCLGHEVARSQPGCTIAHLDLAGRQDAGRQAVPGRSRKLAILARLPGWLRQTVVRIALGKMMRGFAPDWQAKIAPADAVLISGGQLFSDSDLNFPIKIAALSKLTARAKKPLAVVAAGVAANWSGTGARMFQRMIDCDLRHIGLRDAGSQAAWRAQFLGGPQAVHVRDPGLLVAQCYQISPPAPEVMAKLPVGICITDALSLKHHADQTVAGLTWPGGMRGFYSDMILALAKEGHRLALFCNGAEEDAALLKAIAADSRMRPLKDSRQLEICPPPVTGRDLALIIAGCRAVIAHRLHACIVAYGLERPIIGLTWDQKLNAFFASVGCSHQIISDPGRNMAELSRQLKRVLAKGVPPDQHQKVLEECRQGIALALGAVLKGSRT